MIKSGPLLTMDPALECDFLTSFNCISFNLSDSLKNKNYREAAPLLVIEAVPLLAMEPSLKDRLSW